MAFTSYAAPEELLGTGRYVLATYCLQGPSGADIGRLAEKFAVGQTVGTWVELPTITDQMRELYQGKIAGIQEVPPRDIAADGQEQSFFLIRIAFPHINFGRSFAALLTTLLGNDASTSVQAKLVDLHFPEEYAQQFPGPKFGIKGLREKLQVPKRPLLLNMIKPCLGFTPETGAEVFYATALGGVDIIKDDELLTNPSYLPVEERIKAYTQARDRAYGETGKRTAYFVNITDRLPDMLEHAKRAADMGADGLMVNFVFSGLDALAALAADPQIQLPILAHYAGSGPWIESTSTGMDSLVYLGKLARLAGADIVLYNTPYGGYPYLRSKYMQMARLLSQPYYSIRPAMPAVGGGVTPGMVPTLVKELGMDLVLAAGGSIQGHPLGTTSGAKAMLQAIEAVAQGLDLQTAAQESPELRIALEKWGQI